MRGMEIPSIKTSDGAEATSAGCHPCVYRMTGGAGRGRWTAMVSDTLALVGFVRSCERSSLPHQPAGTGLRGSP